MKRTGFLYEKMCDKEVIRKAIIMASRHKRRRKTVKRILKNIDAYVDELHTMMVNETFTPSPYHRFQIKDGATQKVREICCPKFYPDQIVHWIAILAVQPVLTKGMYEFNCGSVPGRGPHYGKKYVERWFKRDRKHTKYCLKLDIRKFYPSLKAPVVMRELRRVIKCQRTLRLLETILKSEDGLPIGNYTSQWFANFALQRLDHFIKEKLQIKHYIRYMDDMCLFGNNKRKLHRAREAIQQFLDGMQLTLKGNWQVFPIKSRAVDFLGFRFFREKTIFRRNLSLRLRRRVKKAYQQLLRTGRVNYNNAAAVMSYLGWLLHADCQWFYEKYIRPYLTSIKKIKEVIRHESRVRSKTAVILGGPSTVLAV
nr:MAG TPA: hypothetical protein [Caudoviricetes sp.]